MSVPKKNIVLFGGGLHANVCIDIIEQEGLYTIAGIIDSKADIGTTLYGYPVLGRQEMLNEIIDTFKIDAGFISIGDNWSRKFVMDRVLELRPDFVFISAIHPKAVIGRNVQVGKGVVIMPGAVVNTDAVIHDFCIVNTGAQLEHNGIMERFSHLSAGSVTGGKVVIGEGALVTLGVTIVDRVSIGKNSVIGSASLVLKDIPDNVLAYGNPAKVIRAIEPGEKFLKSN